MQALFLMQIQNFKSDFRDFDFLLFLGIKSESNLYRRAFKGFLFPSKIGLFGKEYLELATLY